MKEISCDIIKDLLPSYIDKTSSESSNKLIKEHLQKCKSCSMVLSDMSKDVDSEIIFNQKEQIDYLKGFRRDKIMSIIKAILIFIIIILSLFLVFQKIEEKCNFFVDINNIYISYQASEKINENTIEMTFCAQSSKYNLEFKYDKNNEKEIYVEPVGKFTFLSSSSRSYFYVDINENTERIFLKDKKGNVKEIWNKWNGFLIKDMTLNNK